jgi:hypothetical protein
MIFFDVTSKIEKMVDAIFIFIALNEATLPIVHQKYKSKTFSKLKISICYLSLAQYEQ